MLNNVGPNGLTLLLIIFAAYVGLWWAAPMTMANNRNRNPWGWVVGAHLMSGPIAVFLLAVLGPAQDKPE